MRKFLIFEDSEFGYRSEHEITPLSFREFCNLELWAGSNNMAYDFWLRYHNLDEIDSFNEDALAIARIELRSDSRELMFNPSGDDETWLTWEQCAEQSRQSQERWSKRGHRIWTVKDN